MARKDDETYPRQGDTPDPAPATPVPASPIVETEPENVVDPVPGNPRPQSPVIGPPASDPEPVIKKPRVKPTLSLPDAAGGTFARPGSRAAAPFRSSAYAAPSRGLGGPGAPFLSAGDFGESSPFDLTDEDLWKSVASRIRG